MAIFGIGTDVVSVRRIEALVKRHPQRFPQRILSAAELEEYGATAAKTAFLAKRFASKEAASKALGLGFQQGITFTDFEVGHDASGKPELYLSGRAAEVADQHGINGIHLTISDEAETAVAFVVLECTAEASI
jgi:holo-[acyl-carrier protein] synthase